MRTVANLAELNRLALSKGASVAVAGHQINARGERLSVSRPTPAPADPPAPIAAAPEEAQAAPVDDVAREGVRLVADQQTRLISLMQTMTQAMGQKPAPSRDGRWVMSVDRGADHFIQQIFIDWVPTQTNA